MDFLAIIGLIVIIYYLIYIILPWFLDSDFSLAYHERYGIPVESLKGKVVWITGASSGIGEHLAYVLAQVGCKLILSARRESELNKVKSNCLQKNKDLQDSDVEVIPLDICDLDTHENTLNYIISKFGQLNILVNNAGRSQRAIWEKIDIGVDRQMFELNVFSHIHLSRIVAKHFMETGQGHLVVNSSLAGVQSIPYSATYCATKQALNGYFKAFMIEKLGSPVAVTIVCPGPIQTGFLAESFTENVGDKYGVNTEVAKNKVSAERCAELMGVAIANKLHEVWISKPMSIQILNLCTYYPNIGKWVINLLGQRFLQNLRDAKGMKQKT